MIFLQCVKFRKCFQKTSIIYKPEREITFNINLVHDISLVLTTPYRMYASLLGELKKQLEYLLEKKSVRPSVSLWRAPVL